MLRKYPVYLADFLPLFGTSCVNPQHVAPLLSTPFIAIVLQYDPLYERMIPGVAQSVH